MNNPQLEAIWCDIYVDNRKILLGSVYVPPEDEDSMDMLIETLKTVSCHENVIVMGDFNAKHPMWYNTVSNELGNRLSEYLAGVDYTLSTIACPLTKNQ